MTDPDQLSDQFRRFRERWEQVSQTPERPRSTMQVVEYSLGTQRKAEVYVNRLLGYLLDPEAPHGMGDEFLRAFLEGMGDVCGFDESLHDLSGVEVSDQVRLDHGPTRSDDERYGEADLVIRNPGAWYLVVEIKFSAGENNTAGAGLSQTEFYREASHLSGRPKEEYVSGGYYVYLHPDDEPSAVDTQFANWTWSALSDDLIASFCVDHGARLPQRTVTQLRALRDDIREITGMSDRHQKEEEKIALYLDHYEAIQEVTETFEQQWDHFRQAWPDRLREALEADGYPAGDWTFLTRNGDWGHMFREGWWRALDNLQPLEDRSPSREDVRISLIHRLDRNRDLILGERTLKLQFRNCGSNEQVFVDTFDRLVREAEDDIADLLPDAAELTGNKRKMIVARHDIEVKRHGDLFSAYIAALETALVGLVFDNESLQQKLTSLYERAVRQTYN